MESKENSQTLLNELMTILVTQHPEFRYGEGNLPENPKLEGADLEAWNKVAESMKKLATTLKGARATEDGVKKPVTTVEDRKEAKQKAIDEHFQTSILGDEVEIPQGVIGALKLELMTVMLHHLAMPSPVFSLAQKDPNTWATIDPLTIDEAKGKYSLAGEFPMSPDAKEALKFVTSTLGRLARKLEKAEPDSIDEVVEKHFATTEKTLISIKKDSLVSRGSDIRSEGNTLMNKALGTKSDSLFARADALIQEGNGMLKEASTMKGALPRNQIRQAVLREDVGENGQLEIPSILARIINEVSVAAQRNPVAGHANVGLRKALDNMSALLEQDLEPYLEKKEEVETEKPGPWSTISIAIGKVVGKVAGQSQTI